MTHIFYSKAVRSKRNNKIRVSYTNKKNKQKITNGEHNKIKQPFFGHQQVQRYSLEVKEGINREIKIIYDLQKTIHVPWTILCVSRPSSQLLKSLSTVVLRKILICHCS